MKKLLFALAFASAVCALCFAETATVSTISKNGSKDAKIVDLQKRKFGDSYRLKIPKESIAADVSEIEIFLDCAKAVKGDPGYFVLGDGRLGTFRADSGRLEERRNVMPLFGMKSPQGTFVAIVKGLRYEYSTIVDVNNGVYQISLKFQIDKIGFSPYEDIVVDLYKLSGDDADYGGMGRTYRKYQLDRKEVRPITERVKEQPALAYTAESVFVRVKMAIKNNPGIEDQTPENEPKVKAMHTFDDFMRIMKDLKVQGVDKAEMCFVGFNSGGFDGRFPDVFPIEPSIGGEAKMREAVALGKQFGYQMTCHVCNTDFYKIAKRFDENDIARNPDGSLKKAAVLAGGRVYSPCFKQVCEKYVPDDYARLADIGLNGTFHVDVTSCIVPYLCCHPEHPCNRQQTADYMNKIGLLARKTFGGFGSEGPCDHVAKSLDYALYASAYPNWVGAANPLVDTVCPIWQIVYHGIIVSNPFYATIDYNIDAPRGDFSPYNYMKDPKLRRLKLVEFGGRPTYYFIGYTPAQIAKIKEAYDEYQPLKYLQYLFMDSHDEIEPDVFRTKYSDGSETVCNYSEKDFSYRGKTVKPLDYALFKSSN